MGSPLGALSVDYVAAFQLDKRAVRKVVCIIQACLVAENQRSLLAFHHATSISALFCSRSARCIRCADALRTFLGISWSVSFDGAYKCTLEGKVEGGSVDNVNANGTLDVSIVFAKEFCVSSRGGIGG